MSLGHGGRRALRDGGFPRGWFCRIWESCLKGQSRLPSSGSFYHLAGQPTPVFLPGESQGWGRLAGYSPRGRRVRHGRARARTHTHTQTHNNALYGLPFCFNRQEHLPFLALSPKPQDRKLTDENPGSCQPPSEQWEDSWAGQVSPSLKQDSWAGQVSPSLKQLPSAALSKKISEHTQIPLTDITSRRHSEVVDTSPVI